MDLKDSVEQLEKAVADFERELAEHKDLVKEAYERGFREGVASVRPSSIGRLMTILTEKVERVLAKIENIPDTIEKILVLAKEILAINNPVVVASVVEFYVTIDGIKRKVTSMFLAADKKLPLSLEIKDAAGNPAKIDGKPQFALSDESAGSLEVAEDGLSALFTPSGKAIAFKIQAKVDADLGEGVKEVVGELDVEVLSGEAVFVGIVAGEPV